MISELEKDKSKEASQLREYKLLGYQKRTIYVHPRDWYLVEAHIIQINELRKKGLRK